MHDFRILGPLEVVGESGPLQLGGPKQRATLAILLLKANQLVSVERLAEDLYEGAPPVTAVTQVQRQVSELRRALGSATAIETRPPGYVLHVSPDGLDLSRFERETEEAMLALSRAETELAADVLRRALALWRGAPLADFAYESFAHPAIERLEEMRLHALEQRIEADLALGRHALLVAELEQLAGEHPLRERFLAQLMLALYRSGRQPEALDVYHRARRLLVDELGIEPTASLRSLERSILSQDPELDLFEAVPGSPAAPDRVLVVASNDRRIGALLAIAEPLARLPGHELIIARLVEREDELEQAVSAATTSRQFLEVPARAAAFTTDDAAADILRMARDHDVELILEDAPPGVDAPTLPAELVKMLERSPADVGLLAGSGEWAADDGIFVPFAGGEHDWAALELSAWLAAGTGAPLRLLGTKPAPAMGGRDASRLLADASLAVQQVFGVEARPLLAHPSEDGLLDAVEPAAIVVVGFSERWRQQGVGESRRTLLRRARPPILLVHRGPKPGGLAPREARTRFSWTVGYRYLQGVSFAPR